MDKLMKSTINVIILDNSRIFTLNLDDLKNECLKQKDYGTLFYLEGNSHTAQYVTAFDELKTVKNLYYKSYNNSAEIRISTNELNKLSKKYQKIFYITDVSELKILDKIEQEIPNISKNVKIILFNSTPFLGNIDPLKCLISKTNCTSSKQGDFKKRNLEKINNKLTNLEKKYKNLHIFDSYNALCPDKKCPIYKVHEDILYYVDNNHLSMEGSRLLANRLLIFFEREYINSKF